MVTNIRVGPKGRNGIR